MIKFINSFNKQNDTDAADIEKSENLIMSMVDNVISERDKKYLLEQLAKSSILRDKFIEYENFEMLSYKAMHDATIDKHEPASDISSVDEFEAFEDVNVDSLDEAFDDFDIQENTQQNGDFSDNDNLVEPILEAGVVEGVDALSSVLPDESADDILDLADDALNLDAAKDEEDIKDNLENFQIDESISPTDETEVIKLDDIPEIPLENQQDEVEEEIISLDEPVVENFVEEEFVEEEPLALEGISDLDIKEVIEENKEEFSNEEMEDFIKADDIKEDLPDIADENLQENDLISISEEQSNDIIEVGINEFKDDEKINFDDINSEEIDKIDDLPEEDISQASENIILTDDEKSLKETTEEEKVPNDVVIDELAEENVNMDSSFGKSLLENLSADDVADISIEELGESSENSETPNISSEDLLSQIDDVLNSSEQVASFEEKDGVKAVNNTDLEQKVNTEEPVDYVEELLDDNLNAYAENPDDLNVLYSGSDENSETQNDIDENILENNEVIEEKPQEQKTNNNKIIVIAAVAVAVTTLAVVSTFGYMKMKNAEEPTDFEAIPNTTAVTPDMPSDANTESNILEANAPDINNTNTVADKKDNKVKELKSSTPAKHSVSSGVYMSVNKIIWDVPDTLSYSTNFQNFLRTAGKSIKLSLSADLLLTDEFAYNNSVKLLLTIDSSGSLTSSTIAQSSGSTQIDKIVLRSVKETLDVIKPPINELKGQNINLNLIIYF